MDNRQDTVKGRETSSEMTLKNVYGEKRMKNNYCEPVIIDLFSGCGGLSKGFEMAGFKTIGFVENWEPAIKNFKHNFPRSKLLGKDITKLSDDDIRTIGSENGKIIGIIGGPPCQGFSTQGKRDSNDPRNSLFMDFVRFVKILRPKFFVMENVKGILCTKTNNKTPVVEIIIREFEKIGYKAEYKILLAADFGVPQLRERVIFLGNCVGKNNAYPEPTHFKNPQKNLLLKKQKKWITVHDAIGNLPPIKDGNESNEIKTALKTTNIWQQWVQRYISWENYLKSTSFSSPIKSSIVKLYNHQTKKQRKIDLERGKYIPEGRHIRSITPCGLKNDIFPDEDLYLKEGEMKKQRYWRLDRSRPSETVITDWSNMRAKIHYEQLRPPSVREVARLQSFQDDFIFIGKIEDMYKEIGNAVPPLLAFSIAESIKKNLLDD
jgi:DNA (cytosine-5)-methyltransferase 1